MHKSTKSRLNRKLCDCGKVATVFNCNCHICQRCYNIQQRQLNYKRFDKRKQKSLEFKLV